MDVAEETLIYAPLLQNSGGGLGGEGGGVKVITVLRKETSAYRPIGHMLRLRDELSCSLKQPLVEILFWDTFMMGVDVRRPTFLKGDRKKNSTPAGK